VLRSRSLNRNVGAVSFCHDQNWNRNVALGSDSGHRNLSKYGFDTLVLKGLIVGEKIDQFEVKINLSPYSFNKNLSLKKFNFKIS
jgi:hypothetical protein